MKLLKTAGILFALISVLTSCTNKASTQIRYAYSYFKVGDIEAHCNTGKITNLDIETFTGDFFQDFKEKDITPEYKFEIWFVSDTIAIVTNDDKAEEYRIIHQDDILIFESYDTTDAYGVIYDERLNHAPLYVESTYTPTVLGTMSIKSKIKECYYFREKGKELHLLSVVVFENSPRGFNSIIHGSHFLSRQNEFNTSYLDTLETYSDTPDTIVYQNNAAVFIDISRIPI